ncbi:hypothetical protein BJ170DRAFT_105571 [Xylariales sp. AK1849]|nr:hypothetical protein BJ170DRAFT_105571 [Xylariales sp. AK1849]
MARRGNIRSKDNADIKDEQRMRVAMGANIEDRNNDECQRTSIVLSSHQSPSGWNQTDAMALRDIESRDILLQGGIIPSPIDSPGVPLHYLDSNEDEGQVNRVSKRGSASSSKHQNSQDSHIEVPAKRLKATRKLACPYFKRNPSKYVAERSCSGPGWLSVHRIKEHLYRRHQHPQYVCSRCKRGFAKQHDLDSHQNDTVISCSDAPVAEQDYDGFGPYEEEKLRSKKHRQLPTEEQKWFAVYQILFPCDNPLLWPSPYYDYKVSYSDAGQNVLLEESIQNIIKDKLNQAATQIASRMSSSWQNVSTQNPRLSTSRYQGRQYQLKPDLSSELSRICLDEHESLTNSLVGEIMRITGNHRIDLSGTAPGPESTEHDEALAVNEDALRKGKNTEETQLLASSDVKWHKSMSDTILYNDGSNGEWQKDFRIVEMPSRRNPGEEWLQFTHCDPNILTNDVIEDPSVEHLNGIQPRPQMPYPFSASGILYPFKEDCDFSTLRDKI